MVGYWRLVVRQADFDFEVIAKYATRTALTVKTCSMRVVAHSSVVSRSGVNGIHQCRWRQSHRQKSKRITPASQLVYIAEIER